MVHNQWRKSFFFFPIQYSFGSRANRRLFSACRYQRYHGDEIAGGVREGRV